MGYDSDHPMALGEIGREGVAIDTIDDMADLFEGIDMEAISASLTINPTAWIVYAMYVAVAESRGFDLKRVSGTIQADILKEYIAQKEWIFPIRPSVRLVRDTIMYSAEHTPRFNPISISGYQISEAGASAAQEVGFTLANAIVYIEEVTKAGLPVDEFAPRLSFFFISQRDFFEEVAKFRALRRVYAKLLKERFGATKSESMRLRFHTQTAAMTLTKSQYKINPMRTALQALAAVFGGAQSMHTNGLDEAFAIPTEEAMKLAIRTQQIIAEETNVTSVVDPLGGSYFVETLTSQIEDEIVKVLRRVDEMGGTIKALEDGWFQRQMADSAYDLELKKADGDYVLIGVNKYVEEDDKVDIETHPFDEETGRRQLERLRRAKAQRDGAEVARLFGKLTEIARDDRQNIVPITVELVKARATLGEICDVLRAIWGTYREIPVI